MNYLQDQSILNLGGGAGVQVHCKCLALVQPICLCHKIESVESLRHNLSSICFILRLNFWGPNPRLRPLKLCTGADDSKKQLNAAHLLQLLPALCFGTLSVHLAWHAELGCSGGDYCAEIANSDQYEL
jgi:hypothetical protein